MEALVILPRSTSIDWWLSESALLTTFITPFGRYCFQHLPFGISSAPGVVCLMDDVLVIAQKSESPTSSTPLGSSSKQPRASKRPNLPRHHPSDHNCRRHHPSNHNLCRHHANDQNLPRNHQSNWTLPSCVGYLYTTIITEHIATHKF